jgi:hypothetical protein
MPGPSRRAPPRWPSRSPSRARRRRGGGCGRGRSGGTVRRRGAGSPREARAGVGHVDQQQAAVSAGVHPHHGAWRRDPQRIVQQVVDGLAERSASKVVTRSAGASRWSSVPPARAMAASTAAPRMRRTGWGLGWTIAAPSSLRASSSRSSARRPSRSVSWIASATADDLVVWPSRSQCQLQPGPQGRQRGAQLVAGVGDQPPLPRERGLQAAQEPVHGGRQRGHLVPGRWHLQRGGWVLIGDLVDLAAQPLHRAERGSGEQPGTRPASSTSAIPPATRPWRTCCWACSVGPCAADHDHPVEAPVDEARPLTCRRPLAGRPGCPLAGTRLWGVP